ncbi:hypothetical protein EIN_495660 [Entamoeba invadens IP1]|uniref:Uncharacterized protein n=1 Tax=Entamoeba invadens IP1 TaxID=370355 RepID=A0A0A1TZS6_ENTIV|nr:hypothetical protein EIN_495660 [Entamoeba invadens IP1]ELP87101.1 hypothetical protein EIN_495660 [Entamoeba invadens IP1]|eukprot:XP_004253872.1 hypothetical protein EIN_495660 [Entamoeba invadens IP1]
MQTTTKKQVRNITRLYGSMTLQSNVECVLLGMLSDTNGFVFTKPQRTSFQTLPFIHIKEMNSYETGEVFKVHEMTKKNGKLFLEDQLEKGVTMKTAKRRLQAKKRKDIMHFLQSILAQDGFEVIIEKEDCTGIFGDVSIYHNSNLLFNKEDIEFFGPRINSFIYHRLQNSKKVAFEMGALLRPLLMK